MSTKNQLPTTWIIGIIIALVVVVSRIHEASKIMALYSVSHGTSQNNLLQFLEDMVGIGDQVASFNEAAKGNNASNKNGPGSGQIVGFDAAGNPISPNSMTGAGVFGSQGSTASQGGSDGSSSESAAEKNSEMGGENAENSHEDRSDNTDESSSEDNSIMNAEGNTELSVESNSETNAEFGAGTNTEVNSGNNAGDNSEINSENNSGNNQGNNPAINAETNSQNNSEYNSGDNSGNNSGGSSGSNSGDNSGSGSGDNSGGSSGDNSGNGPGSNLPTINPIPSDDEVSQSIAKQDEQSDALAALIAGRAALVVPVQQQAQASKYQTVTAQNIPAPSTSQPPADVEAKIQAKQLTYH